MAAQRVCGIAKLLRHILKNISANCHRRSLFAASQVKPMWHDAATDILWRFPPPLALYYLGRRFAFNRRAFYAAKIREVGPDALRADLDCILGTPLPRLDRLSINSGILCRNATGMEHLRHLLPPGQLTCFEISDCTAL
jgi:hypothetical protein